MDKAEALERLAWSPGDSELRVAVAMPNGEVVTGPLVGIQDVQEDGKPVTVFVASAFRVLVIA